MMSFNRLLNMSSMVLNAMPTTEEFMTTMTDGHLDHLMALPLDQFDPIKVTDDMVRWTHYMKDMQPLIQKGRNDFFASLSIRRDGDGFMLVSEVECDHAKVWRRLFFQSLEEQYPHYGVFSHPEPTNRPQPAPAGFRCSPQEKHTRNTPCREDRPALGKRRLYKSNAYLTHARRLSVGLEERREDGTCDIWLSEEERALVCKSSNTGRQS